jgi:hypothetical protein
MTQPSARLDDLRQQLAALRTRFVEVGAHAAEVAAEVKASTAPSEGLLDDLRAIAADFDELRLAVVEEAAALPSPPELASIRTLTELEALLTALERAEAERARRAAWEAARENALGVLDRVMALIHREDKDSPALAECQGKARELHGALSAAEPADLEHETTMVSGRIRPFVELITLAEGWNRLDDERCAFLQDAITQSFGRQLGLAALRGKLGHEGEIIGAPEPAHFVPAAGYVPLVPGQPAPAGYVAAPVAGGVVPIAGVAPGAGGAPAAGGVPVTGVPVAGVPVAGGAPVAGGVPAAGVPVAGVPAAGGVPVAGGVPAGGVPVAPGGSSVASPPGVVVTTPGGMVTGGGPVVVGGGVAPPGAPLVVEIRLSGERVQVETPEERREREELLERLAAETAQWWVTARAGFETIVARGTPAAEAMRDTLKRFPYLLSVPLPRSSEFEGGRLAEGYAILLQRLEKDEPGFVKEALTRLNPQFTTRAKDETYPLGQELYLYVVAEGRLYKTYPDFVKDALLHAVPQPGLWLQGAITDTDETTTIVTRGEEPGSREQDSRTLTDPAERFTTHTFAVTTGPLTARFFTVQASELPNATDLEVRLQENGAATDHAWIVVVPMSGKPEAPRKHRVGGTKVEELGKQCRAVWIAAFNPDPNADRRYELTVGLKRKAPPPPKPEEKIAASKFAKATSPFPFKPKR